jgi:hypothetical protein
MPVNSRKTFDIFVSTESVILLISVFGGGEVGMSGWGGLESAFDSFSLYSHVHVIIPLLGLDSIYMLKFITLSFFPILKIHRSLFRINFLVLI